MIEWFNNNQDFLSIVLSIVGVIISGVAIYISNNVSKKQNRIALFGSKFDVYKELHDYFNGPFGKPKAISMFLMLDSNMTSDKAFIPEINEIIEKASLLFSKHLIDILFEIRNKYEEVRNLDSMINSYFSLLNETADFFEVKSQYVEYLQGESPTAEKEKQFAVLCQRTELIKQERIGYNEFESVRYNFYELNKKQSHIYQEITEMQKRVLDAMIGEIKLSK